MRVEAGAHKSQQRKEDVQNVGNHESQITNDLRIINGTIILLLNNVNHSSETTFIDHVAHLMCISLSLYDIRYKLVRASC